MKARKDSPKTERQRLTEAADALLVRAEFEQPTDLRESADGSRLIAQSRYMVPLAPTDKRGEDRYDPDAELMVFADPHPFKGEAQNVPDGPVIGRIRSPDGQFWFPIVDRDGRHEVMIGDESIPIDRISGIVTFPDGKRRYTVVSEQIKTWNHVSMREYEAPSRAQEWLFRGPSDAVNMVERYLRLVGVYLAWWLRETRPRMSERTIERATQIAEYYIAESSPCLVYRGRYVPPEREWRERRPATTSRRISPLAATAAAFHVSRPTARRIIRDLRLFFASTLYHQKAARYDALAARNATHLL